MLASTTKNAISEAITKLPENVRNLNAKVKKLDTITKQQSIDLATLQEKQLDSENKYDIQQTSISEISQQLQHLDSRQSAHKNNVHAITEKLTNVQSELTGTINQLQTTMNVNQDNNTAS